ncbi:tripartite motif containing 71, E3 ubiquitin protein ligase [Sparganum proliferum]
MAGLQITADEPYNNPYVLPCQHCFCRSPCLEDVLHSKRQECPTCKKAFDQTDLRPLISNQDCMKFTCCAECGKEVNEKELNTSLLFDGPVCTNCAATEALIDSQNLLKDGDLEFCFELDCAGPPACPKRHLDIMTS